MKSEIRKWSEKYFNKSENHPNASTAVKVDSKWL
jgi:hypothetical protein